MPLGYFKKPQIQNVQSETNCGTPVFKPGCLPVLVHSMKSTGYANVA